MNARVESESILRLDNNFQHSKQIVLKLQITKTASIGVTQLQWQEGVDADCKQGIKD